MSELAENLDAALAHAAAKIAEADTVEEAQGWQSIMSNLNATLNHVYPVQEVPTDSYKDLETDTPRNEQGNEQSD